MRLGLRIQFGASGILVTLTGALLALTLLDVPWIEAFVSSETLYGGDAEQP